MKKSVDQLVAEAKAKIENLSAAQVAEEQKAGALVIDLREQDERDEHGVIPGATIVARGMLEWYADPSSSYHRSEFEPDRRIIFHCAGGGRSALAAETLQEMGYTNVAHLEGGFSAWKTENLPVEKR